MKYLWLDKIYEKLILSDKFLYGIVQGGLAIIAGLLIFMSVVLTYGDMDSHRPLKIQIRIEKKVDRIEEKIDKLIKLGEKYE